MLLPPSFELSSEQISDITNPSVVRVFNYITGDITIPDFQIDFGNLKLKALDEMYTEKVDIGASGTGFFVSSDGICSY